MARYSRFLSHAKFLAQGVDRIVSDIDLDVGDAHLGASADETLRKREADALASPRHDGPLAPDRKWHLDGTSPPCLLSVSEGGATCPITCQSPHIRLGGNINFFLSSCLFLSISA